MSTQDWWGLALWDHFGCMYVALQAEQVDASSGSMTTYLPSTLLTSISITENLKRVTPNCGDRLLFTASASP
ncbi:Phosphoribosyl pyrophosphate synthase-associated protein 1 [Fusarium oxysporum f. sp. albedinis]|nr:Phosphoribosyl pyrophosphate synthase-associated protein 1 [Fusarium oxysporum f. sp. albedinis]